MAAMGDGRNSFSSVIVISVIFVVGGAVVVIVVAHPRRLLLHRHHHYVACCWEKGRTRRGGLSTRLGHGESHYLVAMETRK